MAQEYFEKFDEIIDKYLPDYGEGETKAEQIVTAVNKLIYKWFNDGDVFDNTFYLPGGANDLSSYANWLLKNVPEVKLILKSIKKVKSEEAYSDLLASLADTILNENFLSKFEDVEKVGSVYECDGPFEFDYGREFRELGIKEELDEDANAGIVDDEVGEENLLGKKVRIHQRYSNLDGTVGTIFSYEGTNSDDRVEVERNGHIYEVRYEDIELLESKVEDDELKEFDINFNDGPNSNRSERLIIKAHNSDEAMEKVYTMPQARKYDNVIVSEIIPGKTAYMVAFKYDYVFGGKVDSNKSSEYIAFNANNASEARRAYNKKYLGKYFKGIYPDKDNVQEKIPDARGGKYGNVFDVYQISSEPFPNADDAQAIVSESLNESSKANYTIEYYLNTATADRRPSTAEDVEEDYIYDTIQASNDLEALEEAFFIQTGEDYYEEIFDDYGVEDTVEGLKDYFDGIDIGDGSTIICKITQGSRVIYDGGLNKQYFLGEVEEDNGDEVDLEPEDLYPLLEKRGIKRKDIKKAADIIYVVYYELNFETDFVEDYTSKEDLIDFIDSDLDERVESLEGYEPFAADFNENDIRWLRKIFNTHSDDEYSKEIDEGEAVFTKENGTPGYLVKDGGKIKFLRNYTEDQVKKLGFTVKN